MEKLQTLYDLAEQHNIGVYFYNLGDAEAAAVQDGTFCAIALNPRCNQTPQSELEHLSHEMGHIETGTLHAPSATPGDILRNEYRCTAWVVHHLIPIDELLEVIDYGYTEVWELAEYFGVSEECILDAVKIYRNKGLL